MKLFPDHRLIRAVVLPLLLFPSITRSETKGSSPSALGWGSAWTEPATEKQRQGRAFFTQYHSAEKAGNFQSAVDLCTRQLQLDGKNVGIHALRAEAYRNLKQYERALADVEQARQFAEGKHQSQDAAEALCIRSKIHTSAKDFPAAAADLQAALKLDPANGMACNNLAWLRATCPDAALRNGRESVRLARRAFALASQDKSCTVADTLAAAYAESGDYPHAVEFEKRALADATKQLKDPSSVRSFDQQASSRLQLFQQHQSYRENVR